MPTETTERLSSDADLDTLVVGLSTATIVDDSELDDAVLPEGLLVLDGNKLPAYPLQDDVIAIHHDYARRRATGLWGEFEPVLLDHFDRFNSTHFFGKLPKLEVKMGRCASPRTILGEYAHRGDHGLLGEIIINQRLFHNGVKGVVIDDATRPGFLRFIDDVLLHEMTHAYCHLVRKQPEVTYRGHGPAFTEECNRIGTTFGLDPVRHAKSKKKIEEHLQRCNQWPHCVRDPDYYLGAVVDVQEPAKEVEDDDLAELLDDDSVGPGEMLRRLLEQAKFTTNTPAGLEALAKSLIAGLRLVAMQPDLLPQFPADLVPPGPGMDASAA